MFPAKKACGRGGEMLSRPSLPRWIILLASLDRGWTSTKHALLRPLFHQSGLGREFSAWKDGGLLITDSITDSIACATSSRCPQSNSPVFCNSICRCYTRPIRNPRPLRPNLSALLGRLNNYQRLYLTAPIIVCVYVWCAVSVYSRVITCVCSFTSRHLSSAVLWLASQY